MEADYNGGESQIGWGWGLVLDASRARAGHVFRARRFTPATFTLIPPRPAGSCVCDDDNDDSDNDFMEKVAADTTIVYRRYVGESDLPSIMALVQSELSEPYVIYTYRYFLQQWPHLSFLAYSSGTKDPIGVIVCKQSVHRDAANRGYIAMLSVDKAWRKRGIARTLVQHSVDAMKEDGVEEVVLETEFDNAAALSLYESLGFIREKRLYRFYMNGKDAFRLILAIPPPPASRVDSPASSYSDSEGAAALRNAVSLKRSNIYNIRVLPEYIAGFDDSDDEVSMR